MSKPRYPWWSYVKAIIRQYPSLKGKEVSGISLREKTAVEASIAETERMRNGAERLAVVDMVFWANTHTLSGAALKVACHYDTARHWHTEFICCVAKNFGLLD